MKIVELETGLGERMELPLSRIVSVKVDAEMIYLDKLKDGTWRLTYTEKSLVDTTLPIVLRIKEDK